MTILNTFPVPYCAWVPSQGDAYGQTGEQTGVGRDAASGAATNRGRLQLDRARGAPSAHCPAAGRGPISSRGGRSRPGQPSGGGGVGETISAPRPGRLAGCQGTRAQEHTPASQGGARARRGGARTGEQKALERALHGATRAGVPGHSAAAVERQRHQAAPHAHLQAVQGQALRSQVLGCHRAVPQSPGQGAGAVLRREEPVPSPGAHPTGLASWHWSHPHPYPRLHSPRHHHPCLPLCPIWTARS